MILFVLILSVLSSRVEFEQFKRQYNKVYTISEQANRFEIFESNLNMIKEHNKSGKTFALAMNQFGDLTAEEYSALLSPMGEMEYNEIAYELESPSYTVDWRNKGVVTGVKNQGQCGSCWAFSTVCALEGCHALSTGNLVSLSESMLVDCDTTDGGCNGGLMQNAYGWIAANGGVCSESDYPYVPRDESCKKSSCTVAATCTGHTMVGQNEDALQAASTNIGPIAIAIDASNSSFQFYSNGVYDEPNCSSTSLDHGVSLIGFGSDDGKDFWLVKNSWGSGWGLGGYILMSKGKNNQCGVATNAVYPTGC